MPKHKMVKVSHDTHRRLMSMKYRMDFKGMGDVIEEILVFYEDGHKDDEGANEST